jgi:hypothetical protein
MSDLGWWIVRITIFPLYAMSDKLETRLLDHYGNTVQHNKYKKINSNLP